MRPTELRLLAPALLVLLGVSEAFLAHNVLYTEGKVVQGLYWMLVALNVPLMLIALWQPKWGLWGGVLLGALLLPWQTTEHRKWAQVHEEVLDIIRYVEAAQANAGQYPGTLSDYTFQQPWTEDHITYGRQGDGFRLSYFMDDDSMSYWYESASGFGYYPD